MGGSSRRCGAAGLCTCQGGSSVVFFCIEAIIRVLLEGPTLTHLEVAESASSQYLILWRDMAYCKGRMGFPAALWGFFIFFRGRYSGPGCLNGKRANCGGKVPSGKRGSVCRSRFYRDCVAGSSLAVAVAISSVVACLRTSSLPLLPYGRMLSRSPPCPYLIDLDTITPRDLT